MQASDDEILTGFFQNIAEKRAAEPPREIAKAPIDVDRIERLCTVRAEQLAEYDRKAAEQAKRDSWAAYVGQRGERYAKCTLANFECQTQEQRTAMASLRGYAEQLADNFRDGRGVTLFGPCGTGKDHLSAAICRLYIGRLSKRVRWVDGMTLFGDLRDSFDNAKASEGAIVAGYTRCDVLAISDPLPVLGELTAFQAGALFRIVDGRYSAMRPTILTVNVTAADAEKRLGNPIVDRLRDSSLMIHCNWQSYRKH